MPKPPPKDYSFKSTQRDRIQRQIDEFLSSGGRIHAVPAGATGVRPGTDWRPTLFPASSPRRPQDRIPLNHVLTALDARREARKATARGGRRTRRGAHRTLPRRRLIYDDFGEPLRWEWVDD